MILAPARANPQIDLRPDVRREPRRFIVMVALAFGLTSIGLLASPSPTLAWSPNSFSSSSEKQLVSLTNQARASAGLKSLKVDSTLTTIARARSKDMIVRDYFSHSIPPDGHSVFNILDSKGYCYKIAGENIGWNTYPDDQATAEIQQAFMNSSGHRANILGKAWDVIGIGAYKGPDGKKMWTVLFADRCGATSPPSTPKPTAKPKPKPVVTPRPTPKPAAKPKPTPKPAVAPPSASPSADTAPTLTPPIASGPEDTGDPGAGATDGTGSGDGSGTGDGTTATTVRDARPGTSEAGLRVVDPGTSPGLLEAVVSGVTGSYLGN